MMHGILTLFTFVSVIFFPWIFSVLLTLAVSFLEPLIPLAVGLFADTLYYSPSAYVVPLYTLLGAAATLIALFVRSRLRTSSMK